MKKKKKNITFDELIDEGLSITSLIEVTLANNHLADGLEDGFQSCDAFQRYNIWRYDILDVLEQNKISKYKIVSFRSRGKVPLLKGGLEYSYSNHPKAIELMKNIKADIKIKLEKLSEFAEQNAEKYLVYKDGEGNFYYDGDKMIIKNPTAFYAVAFDIVYSLVEKGGVATYKDIFKKINKVQYKNKSNRMSLNNALINETNGFFNYVFVCGDRLSNINLHGKKLIEVARDVGIRFNNHALD